MSGRHVDGSAYSQLMKSEEADVRLWHKADIPVALSNVRFRGKADTRNLLGKCSLLASGR